MRTLAPTHPSAGLAGSARHPLTVTPLVLARAETRQVLRHPALVAGAAGVAIVLALGGVTPSVLIGAALGLVVSGGLLQLR